MEPTRLLAIGKIIGAHGIKGVVKVFSYAESVSRYESGESLYLKDPCGIEFALNILWAKPQPKNTLLSLEGIETRNQAEELVGSELYIDKASLEPLEEDTYYWKDLLGMSVYDDLAVYIGKITSIIRTGSNDVYVVQKQDGDELVEVLVPALASVVKDVDLKQNKMSVKLPEGL